MMLRQLSIASIALTAALICIVTDCRTSEAQGLLRRIQNRIEARLQPPPEATETPQTEPRQPRYAPTPQRAQGGGNRPTPETSPPAVDANKYGSSILSQDEGLELRVDAQRSASEPTANPPTSSQVASLDRPSLGIFVIESRNGTPGLQVTSIRPDSLADEAGLKEGDLITAIDGEPTPKLANVAHHFEGLRSGDRIRATIVRGRTTQSIMIPLVGSIVATAKPEIQSPKRDLPQAPIDLGITVEESRGVRGLIVTDVAANSPAAAAGLLSGDRIVSLDGRLLANVETLNRELKSRSSGKELSMQLVRDGKLIVADVASSGPDDLPKAGAPSTVDGPNAVLDGLGSMLGGLLGGKAESKAGTAEQQDAKASGDKKVEQAGFESEVRDPPSLRTLELPAVRAGEPAPLELKAPEQTPPTEKSVEAIREEIRRLEERLKELEANK